MSCHVMSCRVRELLSTLHKLYHFRQPMDTTSPVVSQWQLELRRVRTFGSRNHMEVARMQKQTQRTTTHWYHANWNVSNIPSCMSVTAPTIDYRKWNGKDRDRHFVLNYRFYPLNVHSPIMVSLNLILNLRNAAFVLFYLSNNYKSPFCDTFRHRCSSDGT